MSDSYTGIDQQYPIKLESMNMAICKKYNISIKEYKDAIKEEKFNLIDSSDDNDKENETEEEEIESEESIDDICFD